VGEEIVIESLIGTRFSVRVSELASVGGRPAVIPEVSGSAHVTGRHEFLIDPDDPLRGGFLVR
jgi:trans-L-3-hydroxyproline dehydratase